MTLLKIISFNLDANWILLVGNPLKKTNLDSTLNIVYITMLQIIKN